MSHSPTVSVPRHKAAFPARPKPTAAQAPSTESTRSLILSAAQRVLEEQGYAKLTLRNVAAAAGVAVGNLTYYFPNKQALVSAMIGALVAEYGAGMDRMFNDLSKTPDQELVRALMAWLVPDSAERKTNRVFRELWAMALHDPLVARAVDDFYDELMARGVSLLCRGHPGLTEESATEVVHLAAMITEGGSVLYGTRPNRAATLQAVTRLAADLLGGRLDEKNRS